MAEIKLIDIKKTFSNIVALKNVNLEITSGEFFTLLGPSGCGKTTLLRTIAGFYKQDQGQIFIKNKNIDNVPVYLRNIGMVFQNYAIFPHMTVFENVAFGLKNRKVNKIEIKKRVKKSLAMTKLDGYEKRVPEQLSGGQQQRVGLARAMVIEPIVLLMDEPLSNLDAKLRIEMREQIRDIQKELGITAVYVTHDQEEALVISDRIAVMNFGEIQQVDSPWEIYKNPKNMFVASFIGSMNIFKGVIVSSGDSNFSEILIEKKIRIKIKNKNYNSKDICIGIRPEEIIIIHKNLKKEDGDNTFIEGIIRKNVFIGNLIQFTVDCNGIIIIISKPKPETYDFIPINTKVTLKISSDSIMTFDSESGARL